MAANLTPPPVGSPQWWLLRLLRQLEARQARLRLWNDYYEGRQPLAFASQKFKEAFGERFPEFTSNFCSLVVEGTAERLEVQGFRFSDDTADEAAWEIWQENDLDASSQLAHIELLVKGSANVLVEPQGEAIPVLTIEDPLDSIVEPDMKDRRKRRAALKRWIEDDGTLVVVVYLPDAVYKYKTTQRWAREYQAWDWGQPPLEPGEWTDNSLKLWTAAGFAPYQPAGDDEWPLPNPLKVVPLVELPNRPRLKPGTGRSEVKDVMSNQDAVNKYRCDALIASEFAAFPQRYLLNYEPEVDPDTGQAREPFRAAIDRLWTVPPPDPDDPNAAASQPSFGQFAAASLEPYSTMIALEVGHMSSISRLPYTYLLAGPQSTPPSGESLKASEAGLEHKVGRTKLFLGEGWEEAMRLALRARGGSAGTSRRSETIWRDSETRNEAVRTDAVVKLHAEGIIDDELAWEMSGLSPDQIRRLRKRREEAAKAEAADEAAAARAAAEATPPAGTTPAELRPAPAGPQMGATLPTAGVPAGT
jgi:hypothetical protein